ncbi:MAG: hypothetical protein AB1765_01760 [Candidatus Hydrogenedentota bacterium]
MYAELVYWHKAVVQKYYILELTIYKTEKSFRYPEGIKFRMICKDLRNDNKVLIDNHYPKGPHIHLDDDEIAYKFIDENQLIKDFKRVVYQHLGVKL